MRSEAQTDLAEISRPLWNNNEPLCLLLSETRRVSMKMKSEEKKEKISVYVCGYVCVFASSLKHHLGAITDMNKKKKYSQPFIFFFLTVPLV